MKVLALAACLAVSASVAAPLQAQVNDDLALTRQEIQTRRQEIVAVNLGLPDSLGNVFWPQYREYRQEMAQGGDRIQQLILDYAKNYQTLTDEQAKRMTDDWFAIQKDQLETRKKWVAKFQKILPAKTVTRFVQIENRLDTIVSAGLMEQIPLVK
jgi:hypothetical protein